MLDGYGQCFIYVNDRGFSELNPVDCGWERCRPGHYYGPTVRENYLLHYIISGSGTFKNERGEYTLGAGQMFVIRPGELTYYNASDDDPWHYSWVGFTGRLAKLFDDAPDVIAADLEKDFEAICDSLTYDSMREEYIAGQLFLLITRLFGEKGSVHSHGVGFASRAASYIEYHYMNQLSVEHMAHTMNIDRRYLSRLFKKEYGMTMQEYIIAARMKHAEAFLKSGYTVAQTAAMTGYADVFNFSKMFKKYYGCSPSQIKNRAL